MWDRFVRIFDWALVVARIVWGFVGSRYARLADFSPTPACLRAHLRRMVRHEPDPSVGHNPLGALMMLALMALAMGRVERTRLVRAMVTDVKQRF